MSDQTKATKYFEEHGWWEYLETSTGRQFYYSPSTNEQLSSLPPVLCTEWWEMRLEGQPQVFYFNLTTSATVWEKPASSSITKVLQLAVQLASSQPRPSSLSSTPSSQPPPPQETTPPPPVTPKSLPLPIATVSPRPAAVPRPLTSPLPSPLPNPSSPARALPPPLSPAALPPPSPAGLPPLSAAKRPPSLNTPPPQPPGLPAASLPAVGSIPSPASLPPPPSALPLPASTPSSLPPLPSTPSLPPLSPSLPPPLPTTPSLPPPPATAALPPLPTTPSLPPPPATAALPPLPTTSSLPPPPTTPSLPPPPASLPSVTSPTISSLEKPNASPRPPPPHALPPPLSLAPLKSQADSVATTDAIIPFDPNGPVPREVIAMYDYTGQGKDLLSFKIGDRITVRAVRSAEWGEGYLAGRLGVFPIPYCRETGQPAQTSSTARAAFERSGKKSPRSVDGFPLRVNSDLSPRQLPSSSSTPAMVVGQVSKIQRPLSNIDGHASLSDLSRPARPVSIMGTEISAAKSPAASMSAKSRPKSIASADSSAANTSLGYLSGSSGASKSKKKVVHQKKKSGLFGFSKKEKNADSTKGHLLKEIHQFQLESYAAKHFEQHRSGPFRRAISHLDRLIFSTEPLTHPFLRYTKPNLSKQALQCYHRLMVYTNLVSGGPGESGAQAMEALVATGIQTAELRDELYLHVVKQLNNNTPPSTNPLWKLFALYVQHFPPTKDLEEWLFSFLMERSSSKVDETESLHCKFCLQRLPQICRTGAGGRLPSVIELEQLSQSVYIPGVFGRSVRDLLSEQAAMFPDLAVPRVLHHITENLKRLNFTQQEGIFRIPGDHDRMFELRLQLDRGQYTLETVSPNEVHTLASLFKNWLQQIPHPLFGKNFDQVIKSADDVQQSLKVAYSLPDINKAIFLYVIEFLQLLLTPENIAVTKMNSSNLTICFAAVLFHVDSSDMNVVLKATSAQASFLEKILANHIPGKR